MVIAGLHESKNRLKYNICVEEITVVVSRIGNSPVFGKYIETDSLKTQVKQRTRNWCQVEIKRRKTWKRDFVGTQVYYCKYCTYKN